MFVPREYQVPAIKRCIEIMTSKRISKKLVVQPTAAGKSWLVAATVAAMGDTPVLVLQPSGELLKQNYEKFLYMGGKATIYSASLKVKQVKGRIYTDIDGKLVRCDELSRVTYATIGSVIKHLEDFKKMGLKHVIIDEAHLMTKSGSMVRQLITGLKITNVLGLTATPVYLAGTMIGATLKMMNRVRGKLFSDIAHVTQIQDIASQGFWSKIKYKVVKTDKSTLRLNTDGSDFTVVSQKNYYRSNKLRSQVIEEIRIMQKEGRKSILVFVPSIEEAEDLFRHFPNSAIVHSKIDLKTRAYVVKAFKELTIPVVININVLSVGFDHPELDGIITARPTGSIAMYYQQIGRGVRIHDNKEDVAVTDFSGNVEKFGRVEHLTFEKLPKYGWGMFGEGGVLLTGFPVGAKSRPTKETLEREEIINPHRKAFKEKKVFSQAKADKETIELMRDIGRDGTVKFWFGKHSGNTVRNIIKRDKGYLSWMYDNLDFKTARMKQLKGSIKKELKLP